MLERLVDHQKDLRISGVILSRMSKMMVDTKADLLLVAIIRNHQKTVYILVLFYYEVSG
jgi:hypothetical protein